MTGKNIPLSRPCEVCGNKHGKPLGKLSYRLFDINPCASSFNVASCANCGFVFYDTPSTADDYNRYYETNAYYASAEMIGSAGLSESEKARNLKIVEILTEFLSPKDACLMDVGCGQGLILRELYNSGFSNLHGIDPSETTSVIAAAIPGISAKQGNAYDIPYPDGSVDLLLYCHVFEHLTSLSSAIKEASRVLKPNGLVFIEVPVASAYPTGPGNHLEEYFFEHINLFDNISLQNLFISHGFEPVFSGQQFLNCGESREAIECVDILFRYTNSPGNIKPDFTLAEKIEEGFCNASLDQNGVLAELADSRSPVYLWGISQHMQLMWGSSLLAKCNVAGLIDRDKFKQNQTIGGLKINSPAILAELGCNDTVIITHGPYMSAMRQHLADIGFKGKTGVI